MTPNGARKLFGTDGIRAIAGEAPLDPTTIYCVGLALAHSLRKTAPRPRILFGRDTRESGPWIAATLAGGLRQAGAIVESAGVITTPAVAFLARTHGFHAGVVISASHNPWDDNGIKLFGADGFKLPDAVELAMEEEIFRHAAQVQISDPTCFAPVDDNPAFLADYIQFLIDCAPGLSLAGLNIVADCANGAAAAIAPELFRRLDPECRAQITLLNIAPDGRNINAQCGALHPEFVASEAQKRGALGLTFDGDADRCMLAGPQGNVINGDAILLMAARDLKARGMLDRRRRRRHHHVQHGTRSRPQAQRHSNAARARRRPLRARRDAKSKMRPSAASSPATSSSRTWPPPATACSPRSSFSISSPAPANPSANSPPTSKSSRRSSST